MLMCPCSKFQQCGQRNAYNEVISVQLRRRSGWNFILAWHFDIESMSELRTFMLVATCKLNMKVYDCDQCEYEYQGKELKHLQTAILSNVHLFCIGKYCSFPVD